MEEKADQPDFCIIACLVLLFVFAGSLISALQVSTSLEMPTMPVLHEKLKIWLGADFHARLAPTTRSAFL